MRCAPALLGLALLVQEAAEELPQRPRDPWVFRCVLDGREDMLVVALHEELWLGYDLAAGRLYGAWRGGIAWGEGTIPTEHGELVHGTIDPEVHDVIAHPLSWAVWGVPRSPDDDRIRVALDWTERRHRIEDGRFVLSYVLVLPDELGGARVEVEESPERVLHPENGWSGCAATSGCTDFPREPPCAWCPTPRASSRTATAS